MHRITYLFFFIYTLIPFFGEFGVLDKIGSFYLQLNILNLILGVYLFLKTDENHSRIISNRSLWYSMLGFFVLMIITFIFSINKIESLVFICRFFSVFVAIILIAVLSREVDKKKKIIQVFFYLSLVENSYIFFSFLIEYSLNQLITQSRSDALLGFSSNLNVTAFSILLKLPIVIYYSFKVSNKFLKVLGFILIFITSFNIFSISSRGAILGLILIFALFFIFSLLTKRDHLLKRITLSSIFIILGFALHYSFYYESGFNALKRVNSFQGDSSTNSRLSYYKDAIQNMIDNPILGDGIGTWKIKSVYYARELMSGYQVPFHVHNDFLQFGAEMGVIGFLIYLIIFGIAGLTVYRNIKKDTFYLFFGAALLAYFIDANLNFPHERPLSIMNFIYLFGFLLTLDFNLKKRKSYINIKRGHLLILLILSCGLIYPFYKMYESYRDQTQLYIDFNFKNEFKRDLNEIRKINSDFPNISYASIPLLLIKSKYFTEKGEYDIAINMIKKSKEYNPYYPIVEATLANVFYRKKEYDSAYYYAKKASSLMPNHALHTTILQKILNSQNKLDEADSLFELRKHIKDPAIWRNYMLINTRRGREDLDSIHYLNFSKSLKIFPEDKAIALLEKRLRVPIDQILKANTFDNKAKENFENKEYESAIENWKNAIEIMVNEDAYYINLGKTYTLLKQFEKAEQCFVDLEKLSINNLSGEMEFFRGLNYIDWGRQKQGCNELRKSKSYGYNLAEFVSNKFCSK